MRIYLAGGMRPRPIAVFKDILEGTPVTLELLNRVVYPEEVAWADVVRCLLPPGHHVFDPRMTGTKVVEDYAFIDLLELRRCDLVIAYLEAANPSGIGLAAEVGYAKGLGKTILFINERQLDRYAQFVETFADVVVHNLERAVPLIQQIRP